MNNAQQARADARAEIAQLNWHRADWKGRSNHVWITSHGEQVFARGPMTAPGSASNKIKRRDINRARLAAKRLAAINRLNSAGGRV